jgi:hypothetical protein
MYVRFSGSLVGTRVMLMVLAPVALTVGCNTGSFESTPVTSSTVHAVPVETASCVIRITPVCADAAYAFHTATRRTVPENVVIADSVQVRFKPDTVIVGAVPVETDENTPTRTVEPAATLTGAVA